MALETLRDVKKIGGFEISHKPQESESGRFIYINHDTNTISFTIQNGAVKENGVNGCQVDTIIETAKTIIEGLDGKFPCKENKQALQFLSSAIDALKERKRNREIRGVEGYEKE